MAKTGSDKFPFSSAAIDRDVRKRGGRATYAGKGSHVEEEVEEVGTRRGGRRKKGGSVPERKSAGRADRKSRSPLADLGDVMLKGVEYAPGHEIGPAHLYGRPAGKRGGRARHKG
jgi:hypothetical protein